MQATIQAENAPRLGHLDIQSESMASRLLVLELPSSSPATGREQELFAELLRVSQRHYC